MKLSNRSTNNEENSNNEDGENDSNDEILDVENRFDEIVIERTNDKEIKNLKLESESHTVI